MVVAPGRDLLILCPQFFSYHEAILEAAIRSGMSAHWVDARGSSSILYKGALKLAPNFVRGSSQAPIWEALGSIPSLDQLTDILIVKGDGIAPATLKSLRRQAPQARTTLYLWDSLRNTPGALELSKLCDRTITFDPIDAAAQGWGFLPLFSRMPDVEVSVGQNESWDWDWSFVGSIHSDRHRVLKRLAASLPRTRHFIHAYVQSRAVQLLRSLRDPGLLFPGAVGLSFQILEPAEYQRIVSRSRAVVDIEHPRQVGVTMRTIETLLSGRKVITTNPQVLDYDIFDPTRVALIDRVNPRLDPAFLEIPFLPIPSGVAGRYCVDNWLKRILSYTPLPSGPNS